MKGHLNGRPDPRLAYPFDSSPTTPPAPARSAPLPVRQSARRLLLPLPFVLAIDIFLIGAGLIVFSLLHHVMPRDVGKAGIELPRYEAAGTEEGERFADLDADASGETVDESGASPDGEPGEPEAGSGLESDAMTLPGRGQPGGPDQSASPGQTAGTAGLTGKPSTKATTAAPSVKPTPRPTPTPGATTPRPPSGSFAARFPGKFTTGAIEKTATSYRSPRISITMRKVENGSLAYSVADVYVSDLKYFRTAFATGKYGLGLADSVVSIGNRNRAVLAMSGDYYGIRDKGIVIRNGVLYRDAPYQDVLILNNDGSMQTYTAESFDINAVLKRGAWQGWSFGPMLLSGGKPMTTFNSKVTGANPRGAVGYYEPGHYCFVLVDGRQPGYSDGMTMADLSQLFYKLGCKAAYNLDGGESAVMAFQGAVFNRPYQDGRDISDILCIVDG